MADSTLVHIVISLKHTADEYEVEEIVVPRPTPRPDDWGPARTDDPVRVQDMAQLLPLVPSVVAAMITVGCQLIEDQARHETIRELARASARASDMDQ